MIYEKWKELNCLHRGEKVKVGDELVWARDEYVSYPPGTVLVVTEILGKNEIRVHRTSNVEERDVWVIAEPFARLPESLSSDEQILDLLKGRMATGRETYGPWKVTDSNYSRKALDEVLDAMHYCAAQLLQLSRGEE